MRSQKDKDAICYLEKFADEWATSLLQSPEYRVRHPEVIVCSITRQNHHQFLSAVTLRFLDKKAVEPFLGVDPVMDAPANDR